MQLSGQEWLISHFWEKCRHYSSRLIPTMDCRISWLVLYCGHENSASFSIWLSSPARFGHRYSGFDRVEGNPDGSVQPLFSANSPEN